MDYGNGKTVATGAAGAGILTWSKGWKYAVGIILLIIIIALIVHNKRRIK